MGILSTVCSVGAAFIASTGTGIEVESIPHATFGWITVGALCTLASLGILSLILRSECFNMDWKTPRMLLVTKLHKYLAMLVILLSQVTIGMGISTLYYYIDEKDTGVVLLAITYVAFWTILIVSEIIFRIKRRTEVQFEIYGQIDQFTKIEFHDLVENQGRMLVILDEYVLDVEEFMHKHPGGRFALKHNVGRDISKYFYGGYALEGNIGRSNPKKGYTHSNFARSIVNELIIGYYEKEVDKTSTICRRKEDKVYQVSPLIKTFFMESVDKKPVPNFKKHYHGFEVLTKHFWIRTLQNRNLIRHYTICNSMDPDLYRSYVLCLDENSGANFDLSLLDERNQS